MAKWKISKKQYSRYEELLKQYNKMRKQITTVHRNLESVTPSSRMPSLVVPQRHRKMSVNRFNISGKMLYKLTVRNLNKMVKYGLKGFYREYKNAYMELYREYLIREDPEIPRGLSLEGVYYSKEQIAKATEEIGSLMHAYNKIANMNPYVFAYLIKTGKIPVFQKLYNELLGGFVVEEKFTSQMNSAIYDARNIDVNLAKDVLSGVNKKSVRWRMARQARDIKKGVATIRRNEKRK